MGKTVNPVWQQQDYAFYSDGTESGATIIGSAGTQQSIDVDVAFHCRLAIAETAGATTSPSLTLSWQYNLAGGGWNTITGTTPIQFIDNANLTDGGATTNRQPTGTGTFVAGRIYETANTGATCYTSSGSDHTEALAHLFIDSAQVSNGQEILIRCVEGGGTLFGGAYTDADINVVAPIPPDDLNATDISSASSTSTVALTQNQVLNATDISSVSSVSNPTLAEVSDDALLADDISSASSTSSAALTQNQVLDATDISSASSTTDAALTQGHTLDATDISSASSTSSTTLSQNQVLDVTDISSASTTSSATLSQNQVLNATDISSVSSVSNPTLVDVEPGTDALLADSIVSATAVSAPALGVPSAGPTFRDTAGRIPVYTPRDRIREQIEREDEEMLAIIMAFMPFICKSQ